MAVSVDTVYQKVLALANKEQRGYVTPQEFNLFADHAQMEILEQYFYDINQFNKMSGNNTDFADPLTLIQEKLSKLEKITINTSVDETGFTPLFSGSGNIYKLGTVTGSLSNTNTDYQNIEVQEVSYEECKLMEQTSITKPHFKRPVYYKYANGIKIKPIMTVDPANPYKIDYNFIKRPAKPNWNFVIVNNKPLYNGNTSTDFELHEAEEIELVYRILKLAGINLRAQEIVQVGQTLEQTQIQQEKQ
tara:strand:- start:19178 stop:19918 length:741 start_codon:yes stop_codon:yes gene_type:complete